MEFSACLFIRACSIIRDTRVSLNDHSNSVLCNITDTNHNKENSITICQHYDVMVSASYDTEYAIRMVIDT